MSRNFVIPGNQVIFKNPFGQQDITLKHFDGQNYQLIFGSDVQFNTSSTHSEIRLGDYKILKDLSADSIIVKKDNATLFEIKPV
tara:strand:- start:185 stop:436 length:252 start_codon:yes stop_codon:yes gene_type:complete